MIGEGGSGGAIAIALADRVLMQENAIYSVISPEGCAAILWRDAGEARKAAAAFKPDAAHCLELGVIDGIVPEPDGRRPERLEGGCASCSESRCVRLWTISRGRPGEDLVRRRRAKFREHGRLRVTTPFLRGYSTLSTGFSPVEAPIFHPLDIRRKHEIDSLQEVSSVTSRSVSPTA